MYMLSAPHSFNLGSNAVTSCGLSEPALSKAQQKGCPGAAAPGGQRRRADRGALAQVTKKVVQASFDECGASITEISKHRWLRQACPEGTWAGSCPADSGEEGHTTYECVNSMTTLMSSGSLASASSTCCGLTWRVTSCSSQDRSALASTFAAR